MIYKALALFLFIGLLSCSSSKFVNQWKNPDFVNYEVNKILVIGITPDRSSRKMYEQKLVSSFAENGVHAAKSIDFFEKSFSEAKKTQEQLNKIENQLIEAGFDAVLFSLVTGSENKVTAVQSYNEINKSIGGVMDYYYDNQHVFYKEYNRDSYKIYHTESALYCICPGKGRELIWKGTIDIVAPLKLERSVSDYVKVLTKKLKEQKLLILE
ncbi:MAG: hypothetical protein ACJAUR_001335 [Ulvibacter sp.]|jgi:hypothetical protein|tara:strand:- start:240 stop:875 length:636 start_codon:yes stop_codon:yes gene_type:complete